MTGDKYDDIAREIVTINAPLLSPGTRADLWMAFAAALRSAAQEARKEAFEEVAKMAREYALAVGQMRLMSEHSSALQAYAEGRLMNFEEMIRIRAAKGAKT